MRRLFVVALGLGIEGGEQRGTLGIFGVAFQMGARMGGGVDLLEQADGDVGIELLRFEVGVATTVAPLLARGRASKERDRMKCGKERLLRYHTLRKHSQGRYRSTFGKLAECGGTEAFR